MSRNSRSTSPRGEDSQPAFGVPGVNLSQGKVPEKKFDDHLADIDISKIEEPKAPAGFLLIEVTDPQKHEDGPMKSYINYNVKTNTDRPEFEYGNFSVVRRYSDFTWLYEALETEFPGSIIPPLPEKNLADRFNEAFIEARRLALEKFLARVAAHNELSTSSNFSAFLQADDEALSYAKETFKTSKPAVHEGFVQGCFHNLTRMKKMFNMGEEIAKSPVDTKFEQMASKIHILDVNVQHMARHASDLVRKSNELGYISGEFGAAFTRLGESEVTEGSVELGNMLNSIGKTTTDISGMHKEQTKRENAIFESPIYEYISLIRAVQRALDAKEQKKVEYMTAIHTLKAKTEKHATLVKQPQPGSESKLSTAEKEVNDATEALKTAKSDYEVVLARVLRELEKFNAEQGEDIRKIVVDYATLQIEYHKMFAEAWEGLMPSLENASIGAEGNAFVSQMHSMLSGGGSTKNL
mmetsp:Transcript_3592/g.4662  ORF Transcript_3592/g.4662 Transcript_3592/m.4662 type:complete len:467 (+) Transcript_3592:111-1511(+)